MLQFTQEEYAEEWDLEALTNAMGAALQDRDHGRTSCARTSPSITREMLIEEFQADARDEYEAKEEEFGGRRELMRELERFVILQVVDVRWREHLENMDYLREGVHLRSMAQKDPLVEYTARASACSPISAARSAARSCCTSSTRSSRPRRRSSSRRRRRRTATSSTSTRRPRAPRRSAPRLGGGGSGPRPACSSSRRCRPRPHEKLGRNEPCWCGSGKKFKSATGSAASLPQAPAMADERELSLQEQLEGIGAQFDWVRGYL